MNQPVFCFSQDSKYRGEREAILDVVRDNDKETWQRFHARKLYMIHPMSHAGLAALEKVLERAAKLQFDGDWDEAKMTKIDFYIMFYHLNGFPPEQAKEKAEELEDQGGSGGLGFRL